MPRFKRSLKKQNSNQSVSNSQGTESTPFLQSTPCLPTNLTMTILDKTHLAPSNSAPITAISISSPSIPSSSYESGHITVGSNSLTYITPISVSSLDITSGSDKSDSSQPAPTVQATFKKRPGRESNTHLVVEAIDSGDNVKNAK